MDIVKQLTLNKAPKEVPLGSIVCAKNIMLDNTASYITRDADIYSAINFEENEQIVGIIPFTNLLIIFTHHGIVDEGYSSVYVYDGTNYTKSDVTWQWHGGTITGDASRNYKGDLIVVVAESGVEGLKVPLKIYNLTTGSEGLTGNQEEEIPQMICTPYLRHDGNLVCGTYTYFIRYCISEGNYTKWFQLTNDIQVISSYDKEFSNHTYLTEVATVDTPVTVIPGGSKFVLNKNDVSNYSIYFQLNVLSDNFFNSFQLGVIIKHDTSVVGRIVGNYDIATQEINIVDNSYIETIEIDEFLKNPVQYCNVKNAIVYNNRLYISNYEEYDDIGEEQLPQSTLNNILSHINIVHKTPTKQASVFEGKDTYNLGSRIFYEQDESTSWDSAIIKTSLDSNGYIQNIQKFISDFFIKRLPDYVDITFNMADSSNYTNNYNKEINARVSFKNIVYFNADNDTYWPFEDLPEAFIEFAPIKIKQLAIIPEFGFFDTNNKKFPIFIGADYNPGLDYYRNNVFSLPHALSTYYQCLKLIVNSTIANSQIEVTRLENSYTWIISSNTIPFYFSFNVRLAENNSILSNFNFDDIFYLKKDGRLIDGRTYTQSDVYVPSGYNITAPTIKLQSITSNNESSQAVSVAEEVTNNRTLIPYQKYNLFLHYVRKDGSFTTGHRIGQKSLTLSDFLVLNTDTNENEEKLTSFEFDKTTIPQLVDYIGWFVTYEKIIKTSIPVIVLEDESVGGEGRFIKVTTSPYIYNNEIINGSTLYIDDVGYSVALVDGSTQRSAQQTPYCKFKLVGPNYPTNTLTIDTIGYLTINPTTLYSNETKTLYRLTDTFYFNQDVTQNNFKYLPGFYSKQAIAVFIKNESPAKLQNIIASPTASHVLTETGQKTEYLISNLTKYVYSHVNLAALSVREDYEAGAFVWTKTDNNNVQTSTTYYNKALLPSMVQDFLELMPAYTALPDKSYTNYKSSYKTEFNQTIRRSDVLSDESLYIGFRNFETNNYKTIFENKGDIINLAGIGLYLLIHTKYSLYVIDRTSRLTAQAKLITPDTFDEDYKEASPSNEGFGGLSERKEAILTKYGYIWLDKENKYICMYDSGSMKIISSDINGFLQNETIVSCRFAEDVEHNRLLVCLGLDNYGSTIYVTLSYNFNTNAFISLHDFIFNDAYNTYHKSYLIRDTFKSDLYRIEDIGRGSYSGLEYTNSDRFNTYDYIYSPRPLVTLKSSYVDIIFNSNYEVPKVLNYIKYTLVTLEDINNKTKGFEGNVNKTYSGSNLVIYTDSCATGLLDISTNRFNDSDITTDQVPVYNKPYLDKGVWNFNYFRTLFIDTSIVKSSDIPILDGEEGDEVRNPIDLDIFNTNPADYKDYLLLKDGNTYYKRLSKDNPLVYGKYFVVRFRFDDRYKFRLESIMFNVNPY